MGDFCMECFEEKFQENYSLTEGPKFDESGLKFMGRKRDPKDT